MPDKPAPTPGSHWQNRLLAQLPWREYKRLAAASDVVTAEQHQIFYADGSSDADVYFPEGAVFSHLLTTDAGDQVEVGTVGCEGLVTPPSPIRRAPRVICQVPGPARRVRAEAFRAELRRGAALTAVVERYTAARLRQMQQLIVCNLMHTVEERMCRWLLKVHDEVGDDRLPLTQEFLGLMIGVRRPTVTLAAGALQRSGFINYGRGWVTVLDRSGLEESACECYQTVRDEFDRLFPDHGKR